MNPLDLSTISEIQVSPDVISQEVFFEETLLMDVKTMAYFGLDPLGTSLWKRINDGEQPDTLVENLSGEFDLEREAAERKCAGIVFALQKTGLVRLVEKGRAT